MSKINVSRIKFVFLLLVCLPAGVGAQPSSSVRTGRIVDPQGQPLYPASISALHRPGGVLTDTAGYFRWPWPEGRQDTLVLRFTGYQTRWLPDTGVEELGELVLQPMVWALEALVVEGRSLAADRRGSPNLLSVVDSRLLEQTMSFSLGEGLAFQPGLRLESQCRNCGASALRMNGLEGPYSLVLLDGRPMYSSLQGVYGLDQIPPNMIERVEVVRHGGLVQYGAQAVAGTVNIVTRQPGEALYGLGSQMAWMPGSGLEQSWSAGMGLRDASGRVGIALYGHARHRPAWDVDGDGFTELTRLRGQTLHGRLTARLAARQHLQVHGYALRDHRRGGNLLHRPAHETDLAEVVDHDLRNLGGTYEGYSRDQQHLWRAYYQQQVLDRNSYYGAARNPDAYGWTREVVRVSGLQYRWRPARSGEALEWTLGAEWQAQHLEDAAPAYHRLVTQAIRQWAGYLQLRWALRPDLLLLAGWRSEWYDRAPHRAGVPRIQWHYTPLSGWGWRLGYARGIRIPQLFDEDLHIRQLGGEGGVIRPQPGLRPESAHTGHAAADRVFRHGPWQQDWTVSLFYTRLRDVFVLEEAPALPSGPLFFERRNGDWARVAGLSVQAQVFRTDRLRGQLSWTFQQSRYARPVRWSAEADATDVRFLRTPDHYGYYEGELQVSRSWAIQLSGVLTGPMLLPHFAGAIEEDRLETTPWMAEHHLRLSRTLVRHAGHRWTLALGVRNYTNRFQQDIDQGPLRDAAYTYGPLRPRHLVWSLRMEGGE